MVNDLCKKMRYLKFFFVYLVIFISGRALPIKEQAWLIKEKGKKYFKNHVTIQNNYRLCVRNIRKVVRSKQRRIRVGFYVSETSKWNMQSLYDLLLESDVFEPFILVSHITNQQELR